MTNAVLKCKDKCSRSDRYGNMLDVNADPHNFGAFENLNKSTFVLNNKFRGSCNTAL